jgi:uncharacterized protein
MYDKGHGVPQNYAESMKWYRLAANQGVASAQTNLGVMYSKGHGVPQDYVRAHMWLNLSAAQGNQNAAGQRDDVAKLMTPAQIAEAQKLAREWQPKRP